MTSSSSASQSDTLWQILGDVLLVQTTAEDWSAAAACSDRLGGGLVLTGEQALGVGEHLLKKRHYGRPVLVDRGRYAGSRRAFARAAFDPSWIAGQRRLGLPVVLPDAGYVGEDDVTGLVDILTRVREEVGSDAVAPLALHLSWLDVNRNLGVLLEHVATAGVPIAVALEYHDDPLGQDYVLHGLLELLRLPVPVLLLRCDVSAIGALCFGATAAAVGTTTGLRHIYPLPDPDEPGWKRNPKPAAVVCLTYAHLNKIDQAVQADRDNPLWACGCDICQGATLDWLASAPEPETAAYVHSLEVLYGIRHDLVRLAAATDRRLSWIEQCSHAAFWHQDIHRTMYQWKPAPALKHWANLPTEEVTGPSP